MPWNDFPPLGLLKYVGDRFLVENGLQRLRALASILLFKASIVSEDAVC